MYPMRPMPHMQDDYDEEQDELEGEEMISTMDHAGASYLLDIGASVVHNCKMLCVCDFEYVEPV